MRRSRRAAAPGRRPAGSAPPLGGGARFAFLAWNAAGSLLLSLGYLRGVAPTAGEAAYLVLIWSSHYGSAWLLLGALAWLAGLPLRRAGARGAVLIAFATLAQAFLIGDALTWQILRYHLNAWVLDVLLTAGDSVHYGAATIATVVAAFAALAAGEWLLLRRSARSPWFRRPPFGKAQGTLRTAALATGAILALVLVDKSLYAWRDLNGDHFLLRYTKLLPHYRPVTVKHFAYEKLGWRDTGLKSEKMVVRNTLLNYPRPGAIGCPGAGGGPRPNILIIPVESLRFDMLNPEVMPRLWAFSRECVRFDRHHSTGILTRAGLFGLLYGLPGTYWKPFLAEQRGPLLIDVLQEAGYRFKVISSTKFTFPQFRRTAFVGVTDAIEDELPGEDAVTRDPEHPTRLFRWLDARPGDRRPFFAFLFPDAPHWYYTYPPEFGVFQPASGPVNFIALPAVRDTTKISNRYRNAVRFDDHVLGEVLDGLRARGLLDRTLVVITGDHGEEFNESGYWGHSGAFTRWQTQVPLLVRVPGRSPGVVNRLTSHLDVPATVLEALGCRADPARYSTGRSLFDPSPRDYVPVTSYQESALIRPDGSVVVLPGPSFATASVEVRDPDYRVVPGGLKALRPHAAALAAAMRDMNRFLK